MSGSSKLHASYVCYSVTGTIECDKVTDNAFKLLTGWSDAQRVRNRLPFDHYNCHELWRSWPTWKWIEIELSSVSCLNNIERLNFVTCLHTKNRQHHRKHDFVTFGSLYQNVTNFLFVLWRERETETEAERGRENKVNQKRTERSLLYSKK